jgi:hypothetical protein
MGRAELLIAGSPTISQIAKYLFHNRVQLQTNLLQTIPLPSQPAPRLTFEERGKG